MANEVELKFEIENGGADALRHSELLAALPSERQVYDTLYYDSEKGDLRRAGYTLRVRKSGDDHVQTVKRKKGSTAGLFVRQEWEANVPGFALDAALLKATPLGRHLDGREIGDIRPINGSTIDRTSWQVEHRGSRIELVLDEGKIAAGNAETPVREVELELKEGKADALFALAEELGRVTPLRLGVLSKSERGELLAEGRIGRAAKAHPARLRPPLTEAEAFHAIAHACLRHFRLNEMVLLESDNEEALHQARVALRRLRSAFSLFRHAVRGAEYHQLREELRWLTGTLGDARNLDVLIKRVEEEGREDEAAGEPLQRARAKAYGKATNALRSARARKLMLRLALWLETGAWRYRDRGARDLDVLAERQLDKQWRRISRRGHDLAELDPEGRHRLRIDIKKLRYAAEFLAPLYGGRPRAQQRDKFISALKALQERLGELNDAWTAETLVARLPARLREALKNVHGAPAQARSLHAAIKAFYRASAAAGYWEKA